MRIWSLLTRKVTDLNFFTKSFFILIGICALIFSALLAISIFESKIYLQTICLQKKCFHNLLNTFEIPIKFIYFAGKFLTVIVSIFGIFIAVHTYKETTKINLLSTHLTHYNNFHSYTSHVIDSLLTLNKNIVDIYFLYNYIFPQSVSGVYSISTKYEEFINKVNAQINKYNEQRNAKTETVEPFRKHQKEVIEIFKKININLPFKPNQSDFYEIESDLYLLLSSINRSFINNERLKIQQKEYY